METAFAETALMSYEDMPTAASLPVVSVQRSATAIVPTASLIYWSVLAYLRAHQCLPALVAMHPLRLLTIPSSQWTNYIIPDLGAVALRGLSFVECGSIDVSVDAMVCEA